MGKEIYTHKKNFIKTGHFGRKWFGKWVWNRPMVTCIYLWVLLSGKTQNSIAPNRSLENDKIFSNGRFGFILYGMFRMPLDKYESRRQTPMISICLLHVCYS